MTIRHFFLWLLYVTGGLFLSGILAIGGAYLYVSGSLPKVDTLSDYQPPIVSSVYSDGGETIAEFFKERRLIVSVDRMPQRLIEAFVSAEDSHFFEHKGIDLMSIMRAALKNLKAGGIVQGGSTITQQVAKSLLLTPEKKFERKFKEAILAWRMEKKLSKEEILYLYLNQIYLGHGAYGVQAAAENYFDKNVEDLTLAECSLLAGLPQAPSRYSPYRNFDRAKERQKYVLKRMIEEGYISPEEAEAAQGEAITIKPRVNSFIADAAYFTEQVRRYLEDTYGKDVLYTAGLKVHTTMNLRMQQSAQSAVRENLRDHDKRRGYRGPQRILAESEEEIFLSEQADRLAERPLEIGDYIEGVLTGSTREVLLVRVGSEEGFVELKSADWAGPIQVVNRDTPATGNQDASRTKLPKGSLLELRLESPENGSLRFSLQQTPETQGAIVAMDPHNGNVKAMVGGFDFYQSQFNRVLQAKRLPGSAIKPLIYAAALDKGYTPATIVYDTPIIYKETAESGEETSWRPKNYSEKFYGAVRVRDALTHSYNVITIKILEDIGIRYASNYVSKLGVSSPIARDLTLALGSSALTPFELASAYTVFANGGVRVRPTYITKVVDRHGYVLESIDPADFPGGPNKNQRLIQQSPERVISPETAYLITNMMESVVQKGTGFRARALGRPVAGKTGTTNNLKDAWFVGYVPQLVAVSWVGYDQEQPLGDKETGSRAAAPAWVEFMKEAVAGLPPLDFPVPDSIEFRAIDPQTGLLAVEDSANVTIEAFAPGTAPTRYALDEKKPSAQDFFKLDLEDLR
ncbi:PBP1A family penicillin-binding protein [Desulfuromonas sp. AOP6]|uniref:penicillin-binding protein 1A n=1 Tax=Desulfuromonas sp. AOP6 TaxID=1566351 RepID=UPI00126B5CE9|nr:PBP1A family penicillin-binding protein [Desulfuromonas sp. AOP6]BCA78224.1 penicillin-binding protein 1A [Desulfuromonas sp. AOP6]